MVASWNAGLRILEVSRLNEKEHSNLASVAHWLSVDP